MSSHIAIGIDGCRSGWIAAIHQPGHAISWQHLKSIQALLHSVDRHALVLVDMIIGLPDATHPSRECDRLARQLLRPHGSRVFPAPPRESLDACDYPTACKLARAATGKAISKQCWNLFPKIRELDALSDPRLHESHPEVVFARLNRGPITASKKTLAGQNTRLRLLRDALPGSIDAYLEADRQLPEADYLADDCIDALALCAAASQPSALSRIPADERLPGIWY
ncbi:MAG: DUF429 domain-containing protein [Coraliomargarita sp.]